MGRLRERSIAQQQGLTPRAKQVRCVRGKDANAEEYQSTRND